MQFSDPIAIVDVRDVADGRQNCEAFDDDGWDGRMV